MDIGAEDMFFCYRWLLLDLKREFQFTDSLNIMEVIWSTTSPFGSQGMSSQTFNSAAKTIRNEYKYFKSDSVDCDIGVETEEDEDDLEESFTLIDNSNESDNCTSETNLIQIPGPYELGSGNPFALFICLAILLLHKDHCIQKQMDYNTLAMYFDKMLRKHDLNRTLIKARALYMEYLELFNTNNKQEECSDLREETTSSTCWLEDKSIEVPHQLGQFIQC